MADSTDYMLLGVMALATVGLIFFIVNFLRCRNQRYDDEQEEHLDLVET